MAGKKLTQRGEPRVGFFNAGRCGHGEPDGRLTCGQFPQRVIERGIGVESGSHDADGDPEG